MAANNSFFVVRNGLAIGNTAHNKQVINDAGQWIGDPTGVIQNSYNQANAATSLAQASFDTANTASNDILVLQSVNTTQNTNIGLVDNKAQAAFDYANTIISDSGVDQYARDTANTGVTIASSAYDSSNTLTIFSEASFNQANSSGILAQAAFDYANTIISDSGVDQFARDTANSSGTLAQAAFDTANTLSGGAGLIAISNDEITDSNLFVNFTDSSTGTVTTLKTSANNLTFNPSSGTLTVNKLDVTPNTNLSAGDFTVPTTSATTFDSFDATVYRSAFYQIQMEMGGSFHATTLTLINSGSSVYVQTSGDVYNSSSLGTFSAVIDSGMVNVKITPSNPSTVVSFFRNVLTKKTLGIPTGDFGWLTDSITSYFDAGFDLDPVTSSFDYGTV